MAKKLPGAYEYMATIGAPAINFGRGLLGYQDPFMTQTMQDRMTEIEAGRTKGNVGYDEYGLVPSAGRFTGGLMDLAINRPADFGLAGSIGKYDFGPEGRKGLEYNFTPDQDTGSTGSAMLDFINRGGVKGAFSRMGTAQAAEVTPSNTGIMSTPYIDRIMDPGSMRAAAYRSIENEPYQEIPGFNFIDAPTSLKSRMKNPQFLNNPRTGIIDNFLMQKGNPGNTIIDKAKSGIGKGFDLGKAAIGGIASLVSGIPGLGLLFNALGPMSPEDKAMKDFYGSEFGLDDIGRVQSGIMAGYAPVSGFGGPGLSKSIDKRIETITKTLKKKNSVTLEKRLKALEALRQKEEQAREKDRADRARANNPGVYANLDRVTGGKGYGDARGFSTARAGKEGAFGSFDGSKGRKDFSKGGIVSLL